MNADQNVDPSPASNSASTDSSNVVVGGQQDQSESTVPAPLLVLRSFPTIVRELIAGGLAGATAKSSVAPLERCKILFQTGKLHSAGVIPTLRSIMQGEGVKGLFRGNGASVLRIIPYSSIHFGLYEHYRRVVVDVMYGARGHHHGVSPVVDLIAGSSAGATAVLVTYPLDLVRTRLAYMTEAGGGGGGGGGGEGQHTNSGLSKTPSSSSSASGAAGATLLKTPTSTTTLLKPTISPSSHSIRGVIASTLRQEGVRGMYHGIGPSMYGILPYAGLKFYVYQHLKQAYLAHNGSTHVVGSSSSNSSSSSSSGVGGRKGQTSSTNSATSARLPVPAMLAFGGIAGLLGQTATYPLDVVRRRMQVEGLKLREPAGAVSHFPEERLPKSTPAALMAIARREGWRVLYSGLSINYMKVVPSTAIGFTLYDYLKSGLDLSTHL